MYSVLVRFSILHHDGTQEPSVLAGLCLHLFHHRTHLSLAFVFLADKLDVEEERSVCDSISPSSSSTLSTVDE